MKSFSDIGLWWLPDHEENEIAGTIDYNDENGLTLNLLGSFGPSLEESTETNQFSYFEQINGVTKENNHITLRECRAIYTNYSSHKFNEEKYKCSFAFLGRVLLLPHEILFSSLLVNYSSLLDWIDKSGFEKDSYKNGSQSYELIYQRQDELKCFVEEAKLSIGLAMTPLTANNSKIVTESAYINIELNAPLTLRNWLRQYVAPLQNFFSLASNYPNSVTELEVQAAQFNDETTNIDNSTSKQPFVKLLYQPVSRTPSHTKNTTRYEQLFSLGKVNKFGYSVEILLTNWLIETRNMEAMFSLYFNAQYNPPRFVEARFLNLIQALEVYHRFKGKKRTVKSKSEYKKLLKVMVEQLSDQEDVQWLKDRLSTLNEVRLYDRLDELYDQTQSISGELFPNKIAFIRRVTHLRNYYTHYDPESTVKNITGGEIQRISEGLSYMLKSILLQLTGFSEDDASKLILDNYHFQQIVTLIQKSINFE